MAEGLPASCRLECWLYFGAYRSVSDVVNGSTGSGSGDSVKYLVVVQADFLAGDR